MSEITGLGDLVGRLTEKVMGIKPCKGCNKRKEWLNEKVPFGEKKRGCSKCGKGREAQAAEGDEVEDQSDPTTVTSSEE
jgi:hypothetical protein